MLRLYCKIGDRELGPFSPEQLKELASAGDLSPEDLVRRESDKEWVLARRLKHLTFRESGPRRANPSSEQGRTIAKQRLPINSLPPIVSDARNSEVETGSRRGLLIAMWSFPVLTGIVVAVLIYRDTADLPQDHNQGVDQEVENASGAQTKPVSKKPSSESRNTAANSSPRALRTVPTQHEPPKLPISWKAIRESFGRGPDFEEGSHNGYRYLLLSGQLLIVEGDGAIAVFFPAHEEGIIAWTAFSTSGLFTNNERSQFSQLLRAPLYTERVIGRFRVALRPSQFWPPTKWVKLELTAATAGIDVDHVYWYVEDGSLNRYLQHSRLKEVNQRIYKHLSSQLAQGDITYELSMVNSLANNAGLSSNFVLKLLRQAEEEVQEQGLNRAFALQVVQSSLARSGGRQIVAYEAWLKSAPRKQAVRRAVKTPNAAAVRSHMTPAQLALSDPVVNSIGMLLVPIPAGQFQMGSPESDGDASDGEKPQHLVRITQPFYLSVYEVTQQQYEKVMGYRPWEGIENVQIGPAYAAPMISWNDAVEFCRTLSKQEGVEYRLPTEAQWEYACRAGTTTAYSFGDDASRLRKFAWYDRNAFDIGHRYAHRVGQKLPNPWGLYDMHGNLSEWCQDWEAPYGREKSLSNPMGPARGQFRVARGGSAHSQPPSIRSASRRGHKPATRYNSLGFRPSRMYP